MTTTAVVLFTRDLRVHDHPALEAAVATAEQVVPLFVLDEAILTSRAAAPNRLAFLLDSLQDLRGSLGDRGASLVVRRGALAPAVRAVCREVEATSLHLSADVSRYAGRRDRALAEVGGELGMPVHRHPGITVVPAEELRTTAGGHYQVFTPYWRRWSDLPVREPLCAPEQVRLPSGLERGRLPASEDMVGGELSPDRQRGGETAARERLDAWFDAGIEEYEDTRDRLAGQTSRLSADLHFGTLSPAEVASRVDRRRTGHGAFLRQLCWRDFNHQLTAANPELPVADHRTRGDRWRRDEQDVTAWKEGRTGYPVVDAAMRQLLREGWMHNRARLIVGSFLTKHLYVDWRVGESHFRRWLTDGDVADNAAQWQWVAGTGTDSRPNRMFNPVTQSQRYDPDGIYIRRYVPELRDVPEEYLHEPWRGDRSVIGSTGYPPPIVVHEEARERFREARGVA